MDGLMLKLKLQYFGHLMRRTDSLEKTLMLGKIEGRRRRWPSRMKWLDSITDSMDMKMKVWKWKLLSHVQLFATPWTAAHQAPLFFTISQSLLKLMFIELVMPSNHLLSPSPPAFSLSQQQGLFKWVSSSHQVAKVLEFQLQYQSFQWIFRTNFP